jgi:hypothetical protein
LFEPISSIPSRREAFNTVKREYEIEFEWMIS